MCVVPLLPADFCLTQLPAATALHPHIGQRRAGEAAAQLLQPQRCVRGNCARQASLRGWPVSLSYLRAGLRSFKLDDQFDY